MEPIGLFLFILFLIFMLLALVALVTMCVTTAHDEKERKRLLLLQAAGAPADPESGPSPLLCPHHRGHGPGPSHGHRSPAAPAVASSPQTVVIERRVTVSMSPEVMNALTDAGPSGRSDSPIGNVRTQPQLMTLPAPNVVILSDASDGSSSGSKSGSGESSGSGGGGRRAGSAADSIGSMADLFSHLIPLDPQTRSPSPPGAPGDSAATARRLAKGPIWEGVPIRPLRSDSGASVPSSSSSSDSSDVDYQPSGSTSIDSLSMDWIDGKGHLKSKTSDKQEPSPVRTTSVEQEPVSDSRSAGSTESGTSKHF